MLIFTHSASDEAAVGGVPDVTLAPLSEHAETGFRMPRAVGRKRLPAQ